MSGVSAYKRCKCRDADGREIGAGCPQLKRGEGSWSPHHGTWYGKAELPSVGKRRIFLRLGGFATKDEMIAWFTPALALIAIPEAGIAGDEARAEIRQMILDAHHGLIALPDFEDMKRRYQSGTAFRPGTAGEYLADWLALHRQADDWAPSTMKINEDVTDRLLLPAIGHLPLDKVRTSHVLDILKALDTEADRIRAARASDDPEVRASVAGRRPPGQSTKKRYLAVLRGALGEATGPGKFLTVNPADIQIGRAGKKGRKASASHAKLWTTERERKWRRAYDERLRECETRAQRFALWRSKALRPGPVMVWMPEHLGAFLDFAETDRLYALFLLTGHCGLRRGEAVGLRREDIEMDTSSVLISSQIVQVGWNPVEGEVKAARSLATVRMDEMSQEALRVNLERQEDERRQWGVAWTDTGLAFTREDGTAYHPAYVTARFERLAFEAGLPPVRFHDLRHGAATLALAGGADMKEVSAMLRHSSLLITSDIYTEVLPELKAEVAAKVASMVPRRRAQMEGTPDGRSPDGLPGHHKATLTSLDERRASGHE